MKKVVVLVVVAAAFAAVWWAAEKGTQQNVFQVALAFAFPKEGEIELHVVISLGMTAIEGPRANPMSLKPNWEEWVAQHFFLRDSTGTPAKLFFKPETDAIPPAQILGVAEGFIFGKIRQEVDYTFDYIPKRAEPRRFRYTFTSPNAPVAVERINFERM